MPNHPSSHAAVQWFIIIDWCKVQSTHDQPVHQAEDQRGGERTEKEDKDEFCVSHSKAGVTDG